MDGSRFHAMSSPNCARFCVFCSPASVVKECCQTDSAICRINQLQIIIINRKRGTRSIHHPLPSHAPSIHVTLLHYLRIQSNVTGCDLHFLICFKKAQGRDREEGTQTFMLAIDSRINKNESLYNNSPITSHAIHYKHIQDITVFSHVFIRIKQRVI